MIHSISDSYHHVSNGHLTLAFSENNVLQSIRANSVMVNLYEPSEFEYALSNVYLRTKSSEGIAFTPLISFNDNLRTFRNEAGQVGWVTETHAFRATVMISLAADLNAVYYTTKVENLIDNDFSYDLVFGQDLALADEGGVKSNECYVSQYLDHQVFNTEETGYVVCSRQNLPQSTGNPCTQVGTLTDKVVGFSTDGYQFFGKDFRFDPTPAVLSQPNLANERFQFEMGYVALQTETQTLTAGQSSDAVFYIHFADNLAGSNVTEAADNAPLQAAYVAPEMAIASEQRLPAFFLNAENVLLGESLSDDDVTALFGETRRFAEKDGEQLLSFFYGEENSDSRYVTLAEKERLLERSTGHMISSGNNQNFVNGVMSSTHGMYGVFNSHVVVGNTSFNKLLGVDRTSLNLFRFSGQRIWVKEGDDFRVLTMPSAFETGLNFSRWFYKYNGGMIKVTSFSANDVATVQLDIETENLPTLDVVVTNQLLMGNNERDALVSVERDGEHLTVRGDFSLMTESYPTLHYSLLADSALAEVSMVQAGDKPRYLMFTGSIAKKASLTMTGVIDETVAQKAQKIDFDTEVNLYHKGQSALTNHFNVSFENDAYNAQKLNETMQWFTHNALVHYATPHGLEQYSGAAWGTRDVSQGPFELFMSMQRYDRVVDLLKTIYSHQHIETGTWPQWFMFDKYAKIQQEDCHGDIVVWPLKAIADYLTATGDLSVLDIEVPYTSIEDGFAFTSESYTVFAHVERQIKHIIDNLIPGTSLSCYGDGDWDDTLQPANQALRENMVSGWTIPLTLQSLKTMANALQGEPRFAPFVSQITELATNMEADYHKLLIKDGVIAGFIHLANKDVEQVEYLLHPSDEKTGIKYRLLPASRSIISETFNKEMAESHMAIIEENLVHPDGVRLMEKMAEYNGGKQSYFKRAELAANLGREVGLQYCHAHIRFIEALCKMGKADQVLENLYKIVPLGIQECVPNAEIRQSNAYFSSSDGKFNDRYEAYRDFDKLKQGEVAVKGGWRIYSSGPGIYINQVISSVFGLRFDNEALVVDPVLATSLGTSTLDFAVHGKPCRFEIRPEQGAHTPKRMTINGNEVEFAVTENAYRTGGALVEKAVLDANLVAESNHIVVWL
ncbi:GH36-type glycosyl hydrolase domain-containing protein [Thaumasiovibrio subtropicus]|uniref:GH36-type glycosyl hydrolase domain-containing protein n=1 Tax=Thaumasiovibrio subtropicus TaxID=1891207 RepID=UPI000B35764D|nr:cellobiose phosphorylase [Thaumasiovibrio subtropicus]